MKLTIKHLFFILFSACIISCSSDDSVDKDEEKPTITIQYAGGFPQACAELQKGQTYTFKAKVMDNKALASYSLDLHHNFDHHTHDDQGETCDLNPIKQAVNPFIFMKNYTIEGHQTAYEINISLTIPNDIDSGDYHCSYSVTDATGWQSRTSVDIKIIE
ncbi:DUF4625 domain-containing protein [Confluentibacter sediminis]|uniref:DUF4625 domain-containing protein n=1 Tax=Confluentibacter sediminis TaxID=2219045 RepID=UPI000DAD5836|nr:DUF4625 domain-containing protein [Confluentibacter sediminis]